MSIKSFKDASLSDSVFLINLIAAIEPRIINWDIVQKGETEEEKENNAKYLLSVIRKMGAVIFSVWEDVTKVNPKMIFVLVCTLFEISEQLKSGGKQE
jgi:plastin-1